MELGNLLRSGLDSLASELFSAGSILSIYSLASTFLIAVCALAWRRRARRGRANLPAIFRAIFGVRLTRHESFYADVKLFILSVVILPPLMVHLVISSHMVAGAVRSSLEGVFGARNTIYGHEALITAGSTIVLFLAYEVGYFLDHYLKHRVSFLWEFHKLHHTAEVLTPVTNYRNHPIDNIVFGYILAVFIGGASGVLGWTLGRETQIISIDGRNIIFLAFLWTIGHLQHSQFWLPFRGAWGLIIMSPAHHQIHHSDDPQHFNRNLGSVLAIWDWMFGTLEIPSAQNPRLTYGVRQEAGQNAHSWSGMLAAPIILGSHALWRSLAPIRHSLLGKASLQTNGMRQELQAPRQDGI